MDTSNTCKNKHMEYEMIIDKYDDFVNKINDIKTIFYGLTILTIILIIVGEVIYMIYKISHINYTSPHQIIDFACNSIVFILTAVTLFKAIEIPLSYLPPKFDHIRND